MGGCGLDLSGCGQEQVAGCVNTKGTSDSIKCREFLD